VGTVVDVGGNYSNVAPGDRVTWSISCSCGQCQECVMHRLPQKCTSLFKYGHSPFSNGTARDALSGTYASHMILRKGTFVTKVPEMVSDVVASPANNCLATIVNSLDPIKLPRYGTNNSAVIQGAGMLGVYAAAWCKTHLNMEHVFVIDPNEKRLETAVAFGAIPLRGNVEARHAAVHDICPRGVDICVHVTGTASVLGEGVNLLRNGGHYAFSSFSGAGAGLSAIKGDQLVKKCLTVRGVHNYSPYHLSAALEFLNKGVTQNLPFHVLSKGKQYKLSEINEAFAAAENGDNCRVAIGFD